jgi:hypothetical protein
MTVTVLFLIRIVMRRICTVTKRYKSTSVFTVKILNFLTRNKANYLYLFRYLFRYEIYSPTGLSMVKKATRLHFAYIMKINVLSRFQDTSVYRHCGLFEYYYSDAFNMTMKYAKSLYRIIITKQFVILWQNAAIHSLYLWMSNNLLMLWTV